MSSVSTPEADISILRAEGRFVVADGLEWYRIDNFDALDPFLVHLTTSDDQWCFISSSGALTAGREHAERAIFPYETDDRLHRTGGRSGPITAVRIPDTGEVWFPLHPDTALGECRRSIWKTSTGDRLRFESHHPGLGLTYRSTWATSPQHGLVRTSELRRDADAGAVSVEVCDGLLDVLPAGVDLATQQTTSTLVDAYRRSELAGGSLALYTLEALVSDQPDPAESLRATAVWSVGFDDGSISVSEHSLWAFRSALSMAPIERGTGVKGAYLGTVTRDLAAGEAAEWIIVADEGLDHVAVSHLIDRLAANPEPHRDVLADIDASHRELVRMVAGADALQETADRPSVVSHFSNTLYNCMRGGVPVDGHQVELADVARFIALRNRPQAERFGSFVDHLRPHVDIDAVRAAVREDAQLSRLVAEYLPLTFSRRHGDPSRPWNTFRIRTRSASGEPMLSYEGNWRDIFQNWEALLLSYPGFVESVVAKFLNASTRDGYNPYRLTTEGVDWEMPEEGAWGNFGYWGDHQIVYLHRLLELSHRFNPGSLESDLQRVAFSSADVPYHMADYAAMVRDPKHTIEFDEATQARVEAREAAVGTDGRLVADADGGVHLSSLAEKLCIPALSKLSNLVPGAGVWMNTQRPEWNDANNALVGHGVSVVTAIHLRDYLRFVDGVFARSSVSSVPFDPATFEWLEALVAAYGSLDPASAEAGNPTRRRRLLDQLGASYEAYRRRIEQPSGAPVAVDVATVRALFAAALAHLDVLVEEAVRPDGLADSYRLVDFDDDGLTVESLDTMLEGQVAMLGHTDMEPGAVVAMVDALLASELYRDDLNAFLLYPAHMPPPFLEKNRVPDKLIGAALEKLATLAPNLFGRDSHGVGRFGGDLANAGVLDAALQGLDLDADERAEIHGVYEAVFNHHRFTGRSSTMYRYEGIGSIYWHMMAKLVVAVQERAVAAFEDGADPEVLDALVDRYRTLRDGLGFTKSPAVHGAFPTDPHSHTPSHIGAQQPGMTGTTKEHVLMRFGELGVHVEDGRVQFRPVLLSTAEFLTEELAWAPLGPGETLPEGSLGFHYCGVPVVYHRSDSAWTEVRHAVGADRTKGDTLDEEDSHDLLSRNGVITRIDVGVVL